MGRPAIAMCCDLRAQTGDIGQPDRLIGADDVVKMRQVGSAFVMLAGALPKATELAISCTEAIRKFTADRREAVDYDLVVNDFLKALRHVAAKNKMELIRHFVATTTGIEHSEFIKLSSDNYIETWSAVRRLSLGADILISHVGHEATIVRLDRHGESHWEANYAAIGDGSEVARAFLCLQPWFRSKDINEANPVPLFECLYRIYEAKCAAHLANPSSVGMASLIQVITRDGACGIAKEMWQLLERIFSRKHKVPDIESEMKANGLSGNMLSTVAAFEKQPSSANP